MCYLKIELKYNTFKAYISFFSERSIFEIKSLDLSCGLNMRTEIVTIKAKLVNLEKIRSVDHSLHLIYSKQYLTIVLKKFN